MENTVSQRLTSLKDKCIKKPKVKKVTEPEKVEITAEPEKVETTAEVEKPKRKSRTPKKDK